MSNNEEIIQLDKPESTSLIPEEVEREEILPIETSENSLDVHIKDDLVHVISPCQFGVSGNISVATNVALSWIAPQPLNIIEVYGYIRTAPVGAAALIDINKNGTSIFATRLTIADGANTGSQKALRITGQPHLNTNDRLDIDVDQVGSGTAGANLSVFIRFKLV